MEQLKQHYEKAILGLAMLALVYVAYGVLTDNSEEAIAEQIQARSRPDLEQKKEMPPMDMREYHGTLARLEKAEPLNLSNPHNLFNPVQWRVIREEPCSRSRAATKSAPVPSCSAKPSRST